MQKKYGPDGYLKIWFPESDNAGRPEALRLIIADSASLRERFDKIYTTEIGVSLATKSGRLPAVLNFLGGSDV